MSLVELESKLQKKTSLSHNIFLSREIISRGSLGETPLLNYIEGRGCSSYLSGKNQESAIV